MDANPAIKHPSAAEGLPWERYDGTVLWPPGTLVEVDLEAWILYAYKPGEAYPNFASQMDSKEAIEKFGSRPVFMILDLDQGETFYKILADENPCWIAQRGCTLVKLTAEPHP